MATPRNIIFLPDLLFGDPSGAASARATVRYLTELGHSVLAYSRDDEGSDASVLPARAKWARIPTAMRWFEHAYSPRLLEDFRAHCDAFRPDYVFFAGGLQKPAILASEARRRGIKTVFLFYINDYYCFKIYSGTEKGPCTACAKVPEIPALLNGCVPATHGLKFLRTSLSRGLLGYEVRRAHKVLGYSDDQLEIYRTFGVTDSALARVGFQFDASDLSGYPTQDGGYFAISGQQIVQKGYHVLKDIFARLARSIRIKIAFKSQTEAQAAFERFGLTRFVESGLIEPVTLFARRDYLSFMANARALILPSYYPTTGEFVLQEAMAMGKHAHVFNVGAHKNMLQHRRSAMVSEVGDFDGFAKNLVEVDDNAELRAALAAGALATSRSYYDSKEMDLLNKVFDQGNAPVRERL